MSYEKWRKYLKIVDYNVIIWYFKVQQGEIKKQKIKIHQKDQYFYKKEWHKLIDEKICILREKLNNSIQNGDDYEVIYEISVELDDLIAEFYRNEE